MRALASVPLLGFVLALANLVGFMADGFDQVWFEFALPSGTTLSLTAPWPNPLRGGTLRVSARLGSPVARLVARVYDARGRVIASLWDGPAAGDVLLTWSNASGRPPAPGLYFLRVDAGAHSETRKLVVVAP